MARSKTDPRAPDRDAVLRAWIALERFDTRTLDAPDRPGRGGRRTYSVDVSPGEPLAWEPGHAAFGQPVASDKVEWRHTLHIGQFDIGAAYERVEAAFPEVEGASEMRTPTRKPAALLALALTADGRPIMDSLQVSSAAWSIARTLKIGVDESEWLDGFDDALGEVRGAFERIVIDAGRDGFVTPVAPPGDGSAGSTGSTASGAGAAGDGRLAGFASGAAGLAGEASDEAAVQQEMLLLDLEERRVNGTLPATVDRARGGSVGLAGSAAAASASAASASAASASSVPAASADAAAVEPPEDDHASDVIDEDGIGTHPITWEHLLRLLGAATKILALDGQLVIRPVVRTKTWQESKRNPLGGGDTLLNSFAVDDLERVARQLEQRGPGAALARFLDAAHLGETEAGERVDVDERLADVRWQTEPSQIPAGRWPADATHDLALGQQLAVNLATDAEAPSIVAVNGPPGTGKTTMLRDLIAAIVTERAVAIATFASPSEMFRGEAVSVNGDRTLRAHKLSPLLAGREILLACATNAAAQNVTLELPAIGAVDAEWRPAPAIMDEHPPYLADLATTALRSGAALDARTAGFGGRAARGGGGDDALPQHAEAWSLIAARLGRRSYCKDFASAIWWGPDYRPGSAKIAPTERAEAGLRKVLMNSQNAEGREAWEASRDRFRAAHARVEEIRAERQALADAMNPDIDLDADLEQAVADVTESSERVASIIGERDAAAEAASVAVAAHGDAKRELEVHGNAPAKHTVPRLTKEARQREADRIAAVERSGDARKAATAALDLVRSLNHRLTQATDDVAAAERRRDALRTRLDARAAAVVGGDLGARESAGAGATDVRAGGPAARGDRTGAAPYVVPDEAWEQDQAARDLRAPWSDEAWNRARTECFLAALDLHAATVLANGRDASRNLSIAMDLLSGRVAGLAHEVVLAAWQTLFMLVPVVSTTFASLPTMLAGLGQEDLGWLLIDEAGQAQPQQAAGAIWRCKRAVIVGDPLQLEPVSTLPTSLAEAIRQRYKLDEAYVSPEASVQRLADAVMPWGGRRGEDHLWVGVPMNVHRRCETLIFDLVNAIAYDGRMVNATRPRAAHPALRVDSCWLDVPAGGPSDGHWNADEGVRLDALLAHLYHARYDFRQVFAVSPFREVAWHLARRADNPGHAGMTGGTVHTIQGREADTVILVLGSGPTKAAARRWVTAKPNLLNVAASRARQRLYVIGDHDAWIDLPYLRELRGLRRVAQPAPRAYA